ncbi:MAG: AAA family ATPase, partial [Desulfovibrionaceae bacterium]|nr:AAA family ATPase [Desulfovibrionaceae bacterium]
MKNTSFSSENIKAKPRQNGDTMSVAILSGKGGVGKTNLALNIARMLYLNNDPVLLMDCDLGLANLDVLLGLDTAYNLHDVISGRVEATEAMVSIEGDSFDFIPAASGQPELVQMDDDSLELLFSQMAPCLENYRYLFLDLGAGISPTVLSFASLAHVRIIVVSPEPTSITDGYAVMKVMNSRYGLTDFQILINQVNSKQEFELASQRLCGATQHFLGFAPNILGFVQQ